MLLPVLFFLYEGLRAQRHVLLLVIVAAVPVTRDLNAMLHTTLLPDLRYRIRQFQERQRIAQGDAWLAFVAILLLAFCFFHSPAARAIQVGKSVTPRLLTFLHQHPDRFQRPLVTTWNAGPLLWNMRPDFRVNFDDRFDFYGDATVLPLINLYNGSAGWRETLAQGRYDSAILDPYMQLNQFLHLTSGWHETYRDEHAVVYWRDAR